MSNRELYRRTFAQCRPSHSPRWEEQENMNTGRRGRSWTGRLATAAMLCATLAVLCGTAYMVNFLGVRDVLAPPPREKTVEDIFDPETGAALPGQGGTLSLAGYMTSPEGKALAEWQEFLAGYDTDHAILDQVGNYLDPAFDKYICYTVYTQEMADKLEEIAAKYDLKLHTQQIDLYAHPEALGSLAEFPKDTGETYWSYMYEEGSCHFDGWAKVEGYGQVDVQFQRSVKGWFNDVTLNVGDGENFEQWSYETSAGVPVMLALGPGRSLIFIDLPDCFATFNVLQGTESGMTREYLEAVAERYDFSKLSPVEVPELLPEPDLSVPAGERTDARTVYAKVLRDLLYNGVLPNGGAVDMDWGDLSQDQFAVYDVDFDGREELILLHTASYMAGMNGLVMEFDPTYTGTENPLYFQLGDWPAFTFYENGMVQVGWSHNQTYGGLWPYELYGYDAEGDYYYRIASVYTADKEIMEEAGIGEEYPDEVDVSGTGTVYYVSFVYGSGVEPAGDRVWDSEEYFAWRDNLLGFAWKDGVWSRAQEIEVPYHDLTEENIAQVLGGEPPVQTVPPEGMPAG